LLLLLLLLLLRLRQTGGGLFIAFSEAGDELAPEGLANGRDPVGAPYDATLYWKKIYIVRRPSFLGNGMVCNLT
jgi:hypothetical protein